MSDDLIERFGIDSTDAINALNQTKKAADGVSESLGEGEKAAKSLSESLSDAEKESKRLEKTIQQQEKLTAEWRAELIRIQEAQKNLSKGSQEYFKLENAAKQLNRAIKENVQDIKGLKIDKKIVDTNIKDLKAQEKAIDANTKASTNFRDRIESAFSAIGINISPITRRFDDASKAIGVAAKSSGQLAKGQDAVTTATTKTTAATNRFKVALAATGIGAIVVAIGTLVSAFFSTQRGADALNRVLMPLKATFQALWGLIQDLSTDIVDAFENPQQALKDLGQLILDNIVNRFLAIPKVIGSAVDIILGGLGIIGAKIREFVADTPLLNNLFDVDVDQAQKDGEAALERFTSGLQGAASATIQLGLGIDEEQQQSVIDFFGEAIEKGVEAGARLEEIGRRIDAVNLRAAKNQGRLNREFQENFQIAQDLTKTDQERFEGIEKARKAQQELADIERQRAVLEIERVKIQNSLNDTSREGLIEQARLESELEEIEARRIQQTRRLESQAIQINKQRIAREQQLIDEIAKKRQELTEADLSEFDKQRAQMNAYYDDLEERAKDNAAQLIEIRKLRALEELEIDAQEAQLKVEREQELFEAIRNLRNTDVENQIQSEMDRFNRLFELAQGDAERTLELEQLLADRIVEIRENANKQIEANQRASAQAQIAALQSISNSATGFFRSMAEDSQELALFEIAVNTAAGIASAVAAGAGVAFPANLAAIAAGIAAVLGGIAQAKAVMTQPPSFLGGGDTPGTRRSGGVDGKGGQYVIVHPNETIIDHHNPEKGLKALSKHRELDGWINRYYGASRLSQAVTNNYTTTTTTSKLDDRRMVSKLSKSIDLQAATVAELRRMGKSTKFKRAG